MAIFDRIQKQTCVYWERTGVDPFGEPKFANPVEISCRWEDIHEEFVREDGARMVSRSRVFVRFDMKSGDLLKLGTLGDVGTGPPQLQEGVYEIQKFEIIPNLRATDFLRRAML